MNEVHIMRRSKNIMLAVCGAFALAATVVGTAAAAPGNTTPHTISRDSRHIQNVNSNKCLGIGGGSDANGADAIQWPCNNGTADQYWSFVAVTGVFDTYTIENSNSSKCLGVGAGSIAEGAKIIQWNCDNAPDQTWYLDGSGLIENNNSHYCMGIGAGSTASGADAIQWLCNDNTPDQHWRY
jgi:hypothetical protein